MRLKIHRINCCRSSHARMSLSRGRTCYFLAWVGCTERGVAIAGRQWHLPINGSKMRLHHKSTNAAGARRPVELGLSEREQRYAIRQSLNDFKTGVPIEFRTNRSRNGLDSANPS